MFSELKRSQWLEAGKPWKRVENNARADYADLSQPAGSAQKGIELVVTEAVRDILYFKEPPPKLPLDGAKSQLPLHTTSSPGRSQGTMKFSLSVWR